MDTEIINYLHTMEIRWRKDNGSSEGPLYSWVPSVEKDYNSKEPKDY